MGPQRLMIFQLLQVVLTPPIGSANRDMIGSHTEVLQTFLDVNPDCGSTTPQTDDSIRTSSYSGIDGRSHQVNIHGMNYLIDHCHHDDRLLIVDDVFDTGLTIQAILSELKNQARHNTPEDIRVAVPYYKPSRNQVNLSPDYFLHETSQWLKYPHSLEGLSVDEVARNRPQLYALVKDHLD